MTFRNWILLSTLMALCSCGSDRSGDHVGSHSLPSDLPDGPEANQAGFSSDIIKVGGSAVVLPVVEALAERFEERNTGIVVHVTSTGAWGLPAEDLGRACDVLLRRVPLDIEDFRKLTAVGIRPVGHVVALEAGAVVINSENPVENLTMDRLRSAYKGEIRNWKELGGKDEAIEPVFDNSVASQFDMFYTLVCRPAPEIVAVVADQEELCERVRQRRGAIGFIRFVHMAYVGGRIKALKLNGVNPSPGRIRDGSYPLARPLYMYTDGYPARGSVLRALVDMPWTREGHILIQRTGCVPLTEYRDPSCAKSPGVAAPVRRERSDGPAGGSPASAGSAPAEPKCPEGVK